MKKKLRMKEIVNSIICLFIIGVYSINAQDIYIEKYQLSKNESLKIKFFDIANDGITTKIFWEGYHNIIHVKNDTLILLKTENLGEYNLKVVFVDKNQKVLKSMDHKIVVSQNKSIDYYSLFQNFISGVLGALISLIMTFIVLNSQKKDENIKQLSYYKKLLDKSIKEALLDIDGKKVNFDNWIIDEDRDKLVTLSKNKNFKNRYDKFIEIINQYNAEPFSKIEETKKRLSSL